MNTKSIPGMHPFRSSLYGETPGVLVLESQILRIHRCAHWRSTCHSDGEMHMHCSSTVASQLLRGALLSVIVLRCTVPPLFLGFHTNTPRKKERLLDEEPASLQSHKRPKLWTIIGIGFQFQSHKIKRTKKKIHTQYNLNDPLAGTGEARSTVTEIIITTTTKQ